MVIECVRECGCPSELQNVVVTEYQVLQNVVSSNIRYYRMLSVISGITGCCQKNSRYYRMLSAKFQVLRNVFTEYQVLQNVDSRISGMTECCQKNNRY